MPAHRFASALGLILAFAFIVSSDERKWYSHLENCLSTDTAIVIDNPLPAGLSKETVAKDLWKDRIQPSETDFEVGCHAYGKQWKSQKTPTWLAVFETLHYSKEADQNMFDDKVRLHIGLYRKEPSGRFTLAATSAPIELERRQRVEFLDFAPYKLTNKQFAFGVRLTRGFMYPGGGGDTESLRLYRVQGGKIENILSTVMSSSNMRNGDMIEDGMWEKLEDDGGSATIAVLKKQTRGVFDLKKQGEGKSAVFKWNGESYDLEGDDPVSDVNAEE